MDDEDANEVGHVEEDEDADRDEEGEDKDEDADEDEIGMRKWMGRLRPSRRQQLTSVEETAPAVWRPPDIVSSLERKNYFPGRKKYFPGQNISEYPTQNQPSGLWRPPAILSQCLYGRNIFLDGRNIFLDKILLNIPDLELIFFSLGHVFPHLKPSPFKALLIHMCCI